MKINKIILIIFLLSLGMTDAFSVSSIMPIPLLLILVSLPFSITAVLESGYYNKVIVKRLLPVSFLLFFFFTVISFMLEVYRNGYNSTAFNHLISYLVIYIYFVGTFLLLISTGITKIEIFKFIYIGVLLISLYTIFEFVGKNIFDFYIDDVIPRPSISKVFDATYFIGGVGLQRARGLTVESGHTAMYLVAFLPFGLSYLKNNLVKRNIYLSIVITALMCTFSSAGFLDLLVGISIFLILWKQKILVKTVLKVNVMIILGIIIIFSTNVWSKIILIFQGLVEKATSIDSVGASMRFKLWGDNLSLLNNNYFLGSGPGIGSIYLGVSSTNLYIDLLVEVGIIGLTLFLLFVFGESRKIKLCNIEDRYVLYVSLFVMLFHYIIIANYYYPWLWVLFAIIEFLVARDAEQKGKYKINHEKIC